MAKPNTVIDNLPAMPKASTLHPVLADDLSRLTTISDDFTFDAMQPDGYASGSLPAVGANVPDAGIRSLSPGKNPTLGRDLTVTATYDNRFGTSGPRPVFDGKGWNTAGKAFIIRVSGIADNRVMEPTLEGFRSVLEMVYYKAASSIGNRSPFFAGLNVTPNFGGFNDAGSGQGRVSPIGNTTMAIAGAFNPGAWRALATHRIYNQTDQLVTVRNWLDGVPLGNFTVSSTDMQASNNSNARAYIGSGLQGPFNGSVARVRRVFTGPLASGSQAQVDAILDRIVAADYAWKMPRLLA